MKNKYRIKVKLISIFLFIIFISLFSSPSWSETWDDLVERDGLFYKKFTDVPFTGKITQKFSTVQSKMVSLMVSGLLTTTMDS